MENLIELVSESARRFDAHPALIIRPSFRTRLWRFRDLGRVVPRAARVIADQGVGPGDRVILWAVNRPEWGIAFLAVAHAGAVSVPLDARHTNEFAAKVAERTGARLVLASRQTADGARSLGLPIVWIESLPDGARRAEPMPAAAVRSDDLAEIVFTSGTTGDPKGAMISHGNLLACAASMRQVFPIGTNERLLSVLPLSHLYEQVIGLITPILSGASVVYPVSRQPAVLLRAFCDFRITMLLIVPQGLRLLDRTIERRVDEAGKRASFERLHRLARRLPQPLRRLLFRPVLSRLGGRLRTVGVGASALDVELGQRWIDMGVDVLQGYGATEMSPVVSFTRPADNRLGTVGQAIPGVEIMIAPDGEILARGPNRFQGYWQNPEATAAVIDGDGWYHTGDLGDLSPDGFLTMRGRKKDMLALPDGQKVYPEDVEAVLATDERLRDATVVGWPIGPDLRVHACLLLDDAGPADSTQTDAALAEAIVRDANARLGAHQQIRGFTIWPDVDFPRTHTLKVRKHEVIARLAAIAASASGIRVGHAGLGTSGEAPIANVTEGDGDPLVALIAQIAAIPAASITPTSRLSGDLNLDSLQRVELLGVIEEELGAYIDDDALQPEATVAELDAMVEAARGAKRESGIYGWPLNPAVRAVGLGFQVAIMQPLVRVFYRVRTTGAERLVGLEGPVVFIPNHCLHTDNAIILSRLPVGWRWKLSAAAAADTIYGNPLKGILASVLANAFPLRREGGVRHSLELLGARLDRGFNILLYPEGKLTVGGPMQPFKPGVGLIAIEGATPVVPMKIHIKRMSRLDAPSPSWRGDVEVVFGDPMWLDADSDPVAATTRLEDAVRAL
jgi:long-chain acyl-CoA synthetase